MSNPTRIIACVIFYDEVSLLPECLESLKSVDEIRMVDGVYADFPHEKPFSTDGSIEVIESYAEKGLPITLIRTEDAWPDEPTKRSAYFSEDPGDWYFIIDADERAVFNETAGASFEDLRAFLATTESASVTTDVVRPGETDVQKSERFFRHKPGIRYQNTHWNIVADDGPYLDSPVPTTSGIEYPGMKLLHVPEQRSSERLARKEEYYRVVTAKEFAHLQSLFQ